MDISWKTKAILTMLNTVSNYNSTAMQTLLPHSVSIHHLGLFREPTTLQPVEYYNNLPSQPHPSSSNTSSSSPTTTTSSTKGTRNSAAAHLAILLDPIVATGGTSAAAIQTLREWGVEKVILLSVLGTTDGLRKAAEEWPEGVEVWVAGVDSGLDEKGMIVPGLGDIGDRLFLALGK